MDRSHHDPDGGYRNPWPTARFEERGTVLRWWWERIRRSLPPNPDPDELPPGETALAPPDAEPGELRATWIGHSTFLIQVDGLNLLTDPHFSERASPLPFAGPRRFVPPGIALDALPRIDAVLLSHDHYDHLDAPSVAALGARFGESLRWFTPLGYRGWLAELGVHAVTELDWWEEAPLAAGRVRCLPAQHWTSRSPLSRFQRLWSSWSLEAAGRGVYFGGDSGWFPGYAEIGERAGPFDLVLLPIGAYEPRWFMKPSHMNPAEAVRAYLELGGRGLFGAMHWGTFRLTDEDPLEPPVRTRVAWSEAGLAPERLWIAAHGESRRVGRLER